MQENSTKYLKKHDGNFTQLEIETLMEKLKDEAKKVIQDKARTYNIPFKDEDMIRKTIILLFQECYLAFDEGGSK